MSSSSRSSNPHQWRPDPGKSSLTPETTTQNGYQHHKVTFGEVLLHLWHRSNSSNSNSPTPLQIWLLQNVFPLVTPMRIFYFSLSLISSFLAYGSFTLTQFYKSSLQGQLLFAAALLGHTVGLIFLMFFRFCAVDRRHYVLKSVGELVILVLVSLLMVGIGHSKHQNNHGSDDYADEVAVLATCVFLDMDAIGMIFLLTPGHHFSLLEAIFTLTIHLGLLGSIYLRIFAMCFISVILVIKNFHWRHVGDAQATTDRQHHLAWVALEVV